MTNEPITPAMLRHFAQAGYWLRKQHGSRRFWTLRDEFGVRRGTIARWPDRITFSSAVPT